MANVNLTQRIRKSFEIGRRLKEVRDNGLADHIGGFVEWVATIGYSRQQADRLIRFYERACGV